MVQRVQERCDLESQGFYHLLPFNTFQHLLVERLSRELEIAHEDPSKFISTPMHVKRVWNGKRHALLQKTEKCIFPLHFGNCSWTVGNAEEEFIVDLEEIICQPSSHATYTNF